MFTWGDKKDADDTSCERNRTGRRSVWVRWRPCLNAVTDLKLRRLGCPPLKRKKCVILLSNIFNRFWPYSCVILVEPKLKGLVARERTENMLRLSWQKEPRRKHGLSGDYCELAGRGGVSRRLVRSCAISYCPFAFLTIADWWRYHSWRWGREGGGDTEEEKEGGVAKRALCNVMGLQKVPGAAKRGLKNGIELKLCLWTTLTSSYL